MARTLEMGEKVQGLRRTFPFLSPSGWPSFRSCTTWQCSLQKVSVPFLAKGNGRK